MITGAPECNCSIGVLTGIIKRVARKTASVGSTRHAANYIYIYIYIYICIYVALAYQCNIIKSKMAGVESTGPLGRHHEAPRTKQQS